MKRINITFISVLFLIGILLGSSGVPLYAQSEQPVPGPPKAGQIPAVTAKKLKNGLTVAVGSRHTMPLVTIRLLVKAGAGYETMSEAGLANLTAGLITKGTRTRSATQIAEQIEFLGGSIYSSAGWNASSVSVTVTSDKVEQALAILADVVLRPSFKQEELDLLRSQTLDGLTYNLKQPGFIANYVASRYGYDEHPAGGTPQSIAAIKRADIAQFHKSFYRANNAVLILTGDVKQARATALAQKYFGAWKRAPAPEVLDSIEATPGTESETANDQAAVRILVVDLPNSGQAAVKYIKNIDSGRVDCPTDTDCSTTDVYFPALAFNSVLGGGYSSRLNQEIRIKRGLSYGAGSSLAWRDTKTNFSTSTQTKSESAAEVAELVMAEIDRLVKTSVIAAELDPRKLVLNGDFERDLETTAGLAERIAGLYSFGLSPAEMNSYVKGVQSVTDTQIRDFAGRFIRGGDIIIVGEAKLFMDDLKKRFPDAAITTIAADGLDISSEKLTK